MVSGQKELHENYVDDVIEYVKMNADKEGWAFLTLKDIYGICKTKDSRKANAILDQIAASGRFEMQKKKKSGSQSGRPTNIIRVIKHTAENIPVQQLTMTSEEKRYVNDHLSEQFAEDIAIDTGFKIVNYLIGIGAKENWITDAAHKISDMLIMHTSLILTYLKTFNDMHIIAVDGSGFKKIKLTLSEEAYNSEKPSVIVERI